MDITNIVDVLLILAVALCGVIGFKRGVLKQLVSTIGFLIVVILAFYLKNPIAEFLSLHLPFFNFGGMFANVTSINIILYQLISFIIVVIILQAILSVLIKITGIIEKILKFTIVLGIPSKILGLLVGLVEGFIIVFLVLFFLKQPAFNIKAIDESTLANKILTSTPVLSNIAGGIVDTVNDLYELGNNYQEQQKTPVELNKDSIDIMLKHKIITPEYVMKLVDAKKINISGIDTIVNKYRKGGTK